MSEEFGKDIITIVDDDGVSFEFEVLDIKEIDEEVFAALSPIYADPNEYIDSDGELVIMKIVEDENGEEILESVDDEDVLNKVLEVFENSLSEEYEIEE
ncbi:MAG: DUF1292 domain-containing protein [Clostridia bacterium]